ncbi:unnamed protein product [Cochlearia groenlandica]
MASKNSTSLAFFFTFNVLFFTLTASTDFPSPNPPMYVPSPSVPSPNPKPVPPPSTPSSSRNCPIDVLKLGACGDILSGLLNLQLGQPSSQQCCSVVEGLVDLEAAVCLCTALRANIVLGINLDVSVSLSVLLNKCNRKVPSGFECT